MRLPKAALKGIFVCPREQTAQRAMHCVVDPRPRALLFGAALFMQRLAAANQLRLAREVVRLHWGSFSFNFRLLFSPWAVTKGAAALHPGPDALMSDCTCGRWVTALIQKHLPTLFFI